MKCCYMTVDGILWIQLVIGFTHFMYFVRNDEIEMFNQSIKNELQKKVMDVLVKVVKNYFNSSLLSAAYMRQWIGSALVR